ncbi:hypothetical protein Tco_1350764 [Tanacetum coccineum]
MASDGNDPDVEYAISRILQKGTMAEYQNEFEILISRVTGKSKSLLASIYIFGLKLTLIRALLWSNPTTLGEAFALARVAEAHVQDLEEITHYKPNKVEVVKTSMVATSEEHEQHEYLDELNKISKEKDDAKPQIFADTFGSNGGNDSETSDRKVERDAKREGESIILATFGSNRDISIWDPEIKSAIQDITLMAKWFRRSAECYALNLGLFYYLFRKAVMSY